MNKLIVANIKMNKNVMEMKEYLNHLNLIKASNEFVVLAPTPFLFLSSIYENLNYGVQNFYFKDEGAYTGEVNLLMLKYMNIKYALIGHSERRKNFKESNAIINKKLLKCLEENITPILCVGESLGQSKTQNLTKAHFKRQLNLGLKGVKIADLSKVIIAYEPTYAINSDTPLDLIAVESNIQLIKEIVKSKSSKTDINVKVLYGGSINENNYQSYLNSEYIDGLLVGRASLDCYKMEEMIK